MPPVSTPIDAEGSGAAAPQLSSLSSALNRATTIYRQELIALTASALLLMAVAVTLSGSWGTLLALPAPLLLLALTPIPIILCIALMAWVMAPNAALAARSADQKFGLSDRLSSAQPFLGRSSTNAVERALLSDAARHAPPLAKIIIHIPLALSIGLPLLGVAGGLLPMVLAPYQTLPASPGETAAAVEADAAGLSVEEIEQVRDLITADAEQLDNPYLEAVARSLADLAQRADDLPPAELSEQIQGLMQHAASAYGSARPGWLPREPTNLAAVSAGLERQRVAAQLAANAGSLGDVPLPDAWDPSSLDPTRSGQQDFQDFLAQSGATSQASTLADNGMSPAGGALPTFEDAEARPFDAQAMLSASRAGASLDAGKGESAEAGLGSQPLGSADPLASSVTATAEMTLTAQQAGKGNLIRISVAPETQYSAQDGVVSVIDQTPTGPLAAVSRKALDPDARVVVARYFAHADADQAMDP